METSILWISIWMYMGVVQNSGSSKLQNNTGWWLSHPSEKKYMNVKIWKQNHPTVKNIIIWKLWVRQLGWWDSQLNGKKWNWCSKPPTRTTMTREFLKQISWRFGTKPVVLEVFHPTSNWEGSRPMNLYWGNPHPFAVYSYGGVQLVCPHSWMVFVNGKIPIKNGWCLGVPLF